MKDKVLIKKVLFIQYLLFILFAIYFTQGLLYSEGSLISQGTLALIFFISGIFFIKTQLKQANKSSFYKSWTFLLLLNVFGFMITGNYTDNMYMFKGVLLSLLTFYPFFYFSQIGVLNVKHLTVFFFLILPIIILRYYYLAQISFAERDSYNISFTNNVAYTFTHLIPFVFLFKQKQIKSFMIIFILMFFIIQGAKRGALITGCVGIVFFVYYQLTNVNKGKQIKNYIMLIIGLAVLAYYAYNYFIEQEYLVDRMLKMTKEGDSSFRDIIYTNIWNNWYESNNLKTYLLGYGFGGSTKVSGIGDLAHNDWLELLSNFGLLGIITYIIFYFSAFRGIRFSSWGYNKKLLMTTVMLMMLSTSFYSMGYTSGDGYLRAIIIAYLVGNNNKDFN